MLNRHFQEFCALLAASEVRFVIVGGYAVGLHGFPRYTGDLDVFVAVDSDNARRLARCFSEYGFADLGLGEQDFLEPDMVIEIGREPLKIQVLTGIDGVTFEQCWETRLEVPIGGQSLPFIGFDALLRNKAASPRAKDRIDFEELTRIRGEQ